MLSSHHSRPGPKRAWPLIATAFGLLVAAGCTPEAGAPGRVAPPKPLPETWPPRAVWVPREAYGSPEEIADLMERIRRAGFNSVLYQVRGNGTAFYRSDIEPLAYEYAQGDPGFDPLAVACREAQARGLAIHAWVNVMPGWRGTQPPTDPRQLYNARPEWFLQDQHGRRQPLGGFYVSLNPCLPEVRTYLVKVCREIVAGYPVQGLHLDYIRLPLEESPKGSDYPRDARTVALYRQATGRRPSDDSAQWTAWRTQQVTQLVRDIHAMVRRTRPDAKLTAAVWADFPGARRSWFQDGPGWVRAGLIDRAFIMNYTPDTATFRQRHEAWQRAAGGAPIAAGIGAYLHKNDAVTIEQLQLARQWGGGVAVFSSNVLFDGRERSRQRLSAIVPLLRDMRAEAVRDAESPDESPIRVRAGATLWTGSGKPAHGRSRRGMVP